MATTLGSMLLASRDPDRLRAWYERALGAVANPDGFLEFGGSGAGPAVLVDQRDDVADTNPEPERLILNFHVDDAKATAAHLDSVGVKWLHPVEYRNDLWFGALFDPDGNLIQIIELTDAYREARGL